MIESGRVASLTELAEAEKINRSYRCRILRLTLLAPDIAEAVLEGMSTGRMAEVMGAIPIQWNKQQRLILRKKTHKMQTVPNQADQGRFDMSSKEIGRVYSTERRRREVRWNSSTGEI